MSSRKKEGNAKTKKYLKCEKENSCQSEEGILAWDRQHCLGQWQRVRRRGLRQLQKSSSGEGGAKERIRLFRMPDSKR